ncbi:glycoside hydrolase/phage tail family protein [Defluviimonas sp. WL0050]|uniref:Glycoside hydrolase/phage tail family protein n=1 Tax=Albidovulum litorale TaxID=2984134 RepID=A0ABT2ZIY8_9RHOB|nr:glycoside hydrolase/phage tail family protein [Defluviimonas sp. WL0050]MCV2871099.1 glycoside hydrolase/phage tail family protein [Defluviimonas sp. WL0050]
MATILLSAAGAAIGGGFGGSILGLSGAVIGRAIGATLGRAIDQRLMGSGSRTVETGRIDRFRLTAASEGAPVGQVWGRMRIAGQVIWASRFTEHVTTSGGGGKGAPSQPTVREFSYSVNVAVALCEGEITRVGRIWADGIEISRDDVTMRVYSGAEDQLPDPKMEAVEGAGNVPAYRGTAYIVFEDLDLSRFGNRVPQFSFEVLRAAQGDAIDAEPDLTRGVSGVALVPGTGEYALATTPVHFSMGVGQNVSANIHAPGGKTDFVLSMEALREELPGCGSASLVVSWFGGDLRCGRCTLKPKVEDRRFDGVGMPWRAGGIGRAAAEEVPRDASGRSIYGGTPADRAVIEAIGSLKSDGKSVVFYPFILLEQLAGNGLFDPWSGAADQPALPWRGRITLSAAPGRAGTPDRTVAADVEVAAFFGTAQASDFIVTGTTVSYTGPAEWSYRRFILHYAHLCAAAGGVDAFCIGSEMRGLTQIRGAGDAFPTVAALRALAADVRSILGPAVKISYAADWTEYSGYQDGTGDLYNHLDPLWADANIDFIGIDNYMPLSDWREGQDHADAHWGSLYNLEYLKANIEGGEGYDWFYSSQAHRDAQIRTPITDDAYGEDWVWRYKDIRSWWENEHFDRIAGVKGVQSPWVPQSKPVWFTEFGCAAIDKGTNEPNKFLDPKSSESSLPVYSNGRRDDLIQMQYLRAVIDYWRDPQRNPVSTEYGGPMIDMDRAHVWAWDARPFPHFPANSDLWSDGENYARGHWMNGRVSAQPLSSVVAEICARSDLNDIDVDGLYGLVRGYSVADVTTGRSALQPLMLAYGFEALERDGLMRFRMRNGVVKANVGAADIAVSEETDGWVETVRATEAEVAGRVRLNYVEAEGDYEARSVEAIFPDEAALGIAQSELVLALTRSEGLRIVERWLAEARVARDGARFALPPSLGHLGVGDVVDLGGAGRYRIDRAEQAGAIALEAVRVEPAVYGPSDEAEERVTPRKFAAPVPVFPLFMDLPLMTGQEAPQAPHLAVTATPWPGSAAVYSSDTDAGYLLNRLISTRAVIGETETALDAAAPGLWDRGLPLRVRVSGGDLSSVSPDQLFNGANVMAIGDGSPSNWELFQFADAVLVGPDTYDLSMRLRGQAGTDAVMPTNWPIGSYVVLMNGAPKQIDMALAARDLARHYRIGPSTRAYDDPSYIHRVEAFSGIGLRPLSPAHLRARRGLVGDLGVSWVRRTRIDGDSWSGLDVPLGEALERYLVRVVESSLIRREVFVAQPNWTYTTAMQAADAVTAPFEIHVAQLSDAFGPGPFRRITVNA